MSKTVLKLRPNDYWRIGEHESWFTDMAANGLHLKKVGYRFVKFEKGEPKNIRYRIDVNEDRLTDEQEELYKEYGWEFITAYGKFSVFSSPEELGAPELHTDAVEQSYTLEALGKDLRLNVILLPLMMVIFLGVMYSAIFLTRTPFQAMIKGQFVQLCFIVIAEFYVFYTIIQSYRSIRALRKSLLEGTPIDHHANWQKNRWLSNSIGGFFVLLSFMMIILPIMTLIMTTNDALPMEITSLPIVRLAEIENNSDLVRQTFYHLDGIDRSNRINYDWSPLATIQYQANERGIIANVKWKDNSGEYSPSVNNFYYKLTFPRMAEGFINDLAEILLYKGDEEIQIIKHPDFDNLYIVEDGETKQIFASIGRNVLYLDYHGNADIDHIIKLMSEKLSIDSK